MQQLHEAVEAVFRSWDCDRARDYRIHEGIPEDLGTAVNVQAMVFGNRGSASGTGVVFTRNPSTGEAGPYGDYLPRAQGEDVVAGAAHTMPITRLREYQPAQYDELLTVLRRLEVHYRDVCDVEFTVEDGRLWLLQTRVGKRGAVAAVRIAVDFVDDPDIALTPAEALARVPETLRERARAEILAHCSGDTAPPDASGIGASPGRVSGRVVLSSEAAADADDQVILVRSETSPEDVAGMAASAGVLTTSGGLVSHAAVVARGWGIPAVVGARDLTVLADGVRTAGGAVARVGDAITIDGSTGSVWVGEVTGQVSEPDRVLTDELPHLARLEAWATEHEHSTTVNEGAPS
jgi:pyruvate,orthophosphate dikinase